MEIQNVSLQVMEKCVILISNELETTRCSLLIKQEKGS